jgi:Polyketide cyclase / dehydrase and lipid transport
VSGPKRVVTLSMSIRIPREPGIVWPYLVDWERLNGWMLEVRSIRVTGTLREGVGVEAEATLRIAGITTRDPIRVTRWEPSKVLELLHLGWVKGTGYMELTPADSGTFLLWRESLVPPWGWLGALGMRVVTPIMRRIFRRDLRVLRELVEAET